MDLFTIVLDINNKTPIYQQLYHYIKSEIQSGKLTSHAKLPSKRKLSNHLSISQNTIQAAYDQLMEEGYIQSYERKGYYVNQLDHMKMIQVPVNNTQTNDQIVTSPIHYDFSYHGVDLTTFPFSIWRKLMKETINEYDKELLQMSDSLGYLKLRSAITEYLHQSRGVNCLENQVIISSGTEILFQTLIQLLSKESIYGIENPGYEKLNLLFRSNRAKYKPIAIDNQGVIPEDVIKSKVNILCITPAHQFPSGEIMPISRRIQLLNWTNDKDGRYIIEDDYDSEFKYSGKPIPALQGLDSNDKVIYMGSLSKSLAPTIRVSYMVLPQQLMKRYRENLSYLLCPVPVIDQKVLYRFISEGYFERHLNKMRNIYKKKRETLIRCIQDLERPIEICGADAGLHLLLKVNNKMSEEQLIKSALNYGVKVYGISKYYFDQKSRSKDSSFVLIGYATMTEADIINAVSCFDQAWF